MSVQMHLNEAYETLGLQPGASPDEVAKAFRTKAKEYHPDVNNSPDAEDRFKKINEAKRVIDNPPQESDFDGFGQHGFDVIDFASVIGMNRRNNIKNHPAPIIDINLTFLESVIESHKKITYDRFMKCDMCNGECAHIGHQPCPSCKGKGGKIRRNGPMQVVEVCTKCSGSGKESTPCDKCNGTGTIKKVVDTEIKLPFGLRDSQIIEMSNSGHFKGSMRSPFGVNDVYGNVILRIHVEKDNDMRLSDDGQNIESDVTISLLNALKGTNIKVKTIKGEVTLKINPNTKNGVKLRMSGYGPGYIGSHIVNVDVEYPKDTTKLIELLELES